MRTRCGRCWLKNKSFSFINIFGLTMGTACCLYILLYVQDQRNYDHQHHDAGNLYLVITDLGFADRETMHMSTCGPPIVPAMKAEFPEMEESARVCSPLRLHPVEFVMQTLTQISFLPLLGMSIQSITIYFVFALPWFSINHANIRYPDWFERWFSLVFTTPNWHRVHHSSYRPETDSHYGDVFTFWDRMFGTAGKANVEKMEFGIELFREPGEQTFWEMMKMPFKRL